MILRAVVLGALTAALTGCGDGGWPNPAIPAPSGLDARPANESCLAPARDGLRARVSAPRAFPNLAFVEPVALARAPGDSSRWFVAERRGRIRVFEATDAVAAAQDFLDLGRRVRAGSVSGLLGFAFHPEFAANGRAFVHYVAAAEGTLRAVVSEFSSPDGGLSLDPNSERVLLSVEKAVAHGGGRIGFGPDGFLYLALGDDGAGAGRDSHGLLGKILRIDVDARPAGAAYGIPPGNPFAGNPSCRDGAGTRDCPEVLVRGVADPRGWSFDSRTGSLWVADAARSPAAAIRVIRPGWIDGAVRDVAAKTVAGSAAAIVAGAVYRGTRAGALAGHFVFATADGSIAALRVDGGGTKPATLVQPGAAPQGAPGPLRISAFGQAADGELYLLDEARGHVRRLAFEEVHSGDNVPHRLSDTGCVDDSGPAAPPLLSLIPFRPNAALWSDGAAKDRWFGLPDESSIAVQAGGDWDLPEGTVLVKHFRLGDRLVETRLFMRHPDGAWAGYTYQWNDAQTEAMRVSDGLTVPVGGQDYTFPSEADCLWCHNEAAGFTLGPETAQLNGVLFYPQTARSANQLATLDAVGVLSPQVGAGAPAYADHADEYATLEARARAYLHVNCSICHRPGGPTPAAIDLRHDTPLPQTGACDVEPALGDLGIPDARIIAPGDSARSELLSRMSRRDGFAMPPLASNRADPDGVALVAAWIDSLGGESCL